MWKCLIILKKLKKIQPLTKRDNSIKNANITMISDENEIIKKDIVYIN